MGNLSEHGDIYYSWVDESNTHYISKLKWCKGYPLNNSVYGVGNISYTYINRSCLQNTMEWETHATICGL